VATSRHFWSLDFGARACAQSVDIVLGEIVKADRLSLPAGIKAAKLNLYAYVDAGGNLIKAKPTNTTLMTERLLERAEPLAGQMRGGAIDVAGGFSVVKVAP
jgi:hypothetical protein